MGGETNGRQDRWDKITWMLWLSTRWGRPYNPTGQNVSLPPQTEPAAGTRRGEYIGIVGWLYTHQRLTRRLGFTTVGSCTRACPPLPFLPDTNARDSSPPSESPPSLPATLAPVASPALESPSPLRETLVPLASPTLECPSPLHETLAPVASPTLECPSPLPDTIAPVASPALESLSRLVALFAWRHLLRPLMSRWMPGLLATGS